MIGRITLTGLLLIHTVSFAQLLYKPVVLSNGYENGELVRNHVEIHYTHYTSRVISGCIIVQRVMEYAHTNEIVAYTRYFRKDTVASFYGTIVKGKKQGTFVSDLSENKFYIYTYKNNVEEGPFQGFYNFGQLYTKGSIKNGEHVGEYTQYYANGKPALLITRNTISDLMVKKYFYINGQPESEGTLYRDKKVNEWVYYDFDGTLKKTEYYNNKGRLLKTIDQLTGGL
jgi:antitoxin component YwqK of YwqJK toxin-antitoxin module